MKNHLVSVVLVTKNSAQTIEKCLMSLRDQTYANLEIIVVDNYSTDQTPEISRKYTTNFFQKGPERCPQRNFGALKARSEYLFFVDSDMEVSKDVVAGCIEKIDFDHSDGLIVPEISFGTGIWSKAKAFERSFYIGDDSVEAPRFFKKAVFVILGGYDEELVAGEDWDLYRRFKLKGYKVGRITEPIYHNEGRLRFFRQMKKKYYYGQNLPTFFAKGNKSPAQKIPFKLSHLKGVARMVKYPLLSSNMLVLRLGEFFFLGLGIITGTIRKKS